MAIEWLGGFMSCSLYDRYGSSAAVYEPHGHVRFTPSKIGSNTSIAAVMQTRSRRVEMPSGLSLPLAFGMNTLLIGSGR
jgi:hypothetical protein